MSGATDSGMVKTMGMVAGAVTLLAIVCIIAARLLGVGSDDSSDPLKRNALIQRIAPVASVRTSLDDQADTAMADAGSTVKTGEELVNGACAACHVAGVAGAPKLGDEEAWAARRDLGLEALVASVINGKGSMPARGGSAYSDEEIKLAVQNIALFEVDDSATAPAEAEEAVAAVEEAPVADEAAEQTEESATDDTAAAEVEDSASEDTAAVEEEAKATEETAAVEEAPAADTVAAATDAPAVVAVAAAALVVGQEPDGVTDNIRMNVNGVCAGCHLTGVANAPRTGDRDAWQLRADKGLDALVASVTNGLNVMPPRGGSALTDEEIPIAIQYLMSK